MRANLLGMAAAVSRIGAMQLAATEAVGPAHRHLFNDIRRDAETAIEAAAVLAELAPHEKLVLELIRIGALVDFPTFTANLAGLDVDRWALIRGIIREVYASECIVTIGSARHTTTGPVPRSDIVGLENTDGLGLIEP